MKFSEFPTFHLVMMWSLLSVALWVFLLVFSLATETSWINDKWEHICEKRNVLEQVIHQHYFYESWKRDQNQNHMYISTEYTVWNSLVEISKECIRWLLIWTGNTYMWIPGLIILNKLIAESNVSYRLLENCFLDSFLGMGWIPAPF